MNHAITRRPGVGATAQIVQHQRLRFSRVTTTAPVLIIVTAGRKELRSPGFECVLEAGDAVAIAQDSVLDITNTPDDAGHYQARWLVWDPALIAGYRPQNPQSSIVDPAQPLGKAVPEFMRSIDLAIEAVLNPAGLPDWVAKHRLSEILVWLDTLGSQFVLQQTTSVVALVRRHIMSAPDADWTAPSIAAHFAMSEATLRRRLSEGGTTVGHLLADVRMSAAMQLLQSTHLPISRIALEVGYESASRFAIRFRERFGFAPSAIRGHQRSQHLTVR